MNEGLNADDLLRLILLLAVLLNLLWHTPVGSAVRRWLKSGADK